nr:hypothetical protein [Tanacetum cinerariifolium]
MHVHIIVKDTRTIDMTIDQQVALDEALVPHASRLRIWKSNFYLRSDITSKESTLQLVYDVLRLTSFYKMHSKKCIVNLEYFGEILHICPRLPGQTFDELLFEEEILEFFRFLGHNGEIRKLTDVNINKLHQPWRSFVAVINRCLSGKSTGYDSLRNSKAYKEYYVVTSGAAPPKTKASVRKTKSSFDTTITPLTTAGTRLSTSAKGKQPVKSSKGKGLTVLFEVAMTKAEQMKLAMKRSLHDEDDDDDVDERSDDQEDDDDQDDDDQDTNNDGDDFIHPKLSIKEEAKDEESFDPIVQTPENSDDEGNDDAGLVLNVGSEEGQDAEDDDDELYRDVNINLEGRDDLPNFGSLFGFDHRLKTLEANFSEFMQTNQFAGAVSSIPKIVERYMDQLMNETVKVAIQIQSDRLRDEAQAKNKEFLNNLDENIQKIIKEQVKEQV